MWNDALPRNGITNWSVFYAQQSSAFTAWLTWMKPAGCSWVYVFAIGSGGGGARTTVSSTVGGGGGGSGPVTRLLIPATFVPDILYIRPGIGGAGVRSGTAPGATGDTSYVCIAPNTTAQNIVLSLAGGTGGGSGTLQTGGAGAAAPTSAAGIWMNIGLFTAIAGQAGGNGAAVQNGNGSDVTFGASGLPITGGAGGGNGTGIGGSIIGASLLPTISGGATTGADGANGFRMGQIFAPGFKLFPLLFSGGSGAAGIVTGPQPKGGNGAYGCGGGGHGGISGATGPVLTTTGFGNGGDALILIGAF